MKNFLYNYYISNYQKDFDITVLCLLHELRLCTKEQFIVFFQKETSLDKGTIKNKITSLEKSGLIGSIKYPHNTKIKMYYLTKIGYQSIAGYYPLPKVPEYNWYHCLMINETLLQTLDVLTDHPHLRYIQTERRQVYEIKDMEKQKNGRIFFVSDFLARFNSKDNRTFDWYFEVELTIKTKKRYKKSVFLRYIKHLKEYPKTRLIYVSPSPAILADLKKFKFELYDSIISGEKELAATVFSRFHIFSLDEFPNELQKLIEEDSYINWSDSE